METILCAEQPLAQGLGVAVVFDLVGFTKFLNQPDALRYAHTLLRRVFEGWDIVVIHGEGLSSGQAGCRIPTLPSPTYKKFLGDGALCLWIRGRDLEGDLDVTLLLNRLRAFRRQFPEIMRGCAGQFPFKSIPCQIRIAASAGDVHAVSPENGGILDYVGPCINLASRLLNYCPSIGLIASAKLDVPEALARKHGYARVVATELRDFPNEIVIVHRRDLGRLEHEMRAKLFGRAN